jgi:hypothetical protein
MFLFLLNTASYSTSGYLGARSGQVEASHFAYYRNAARFVLVKNNLCY